MTMRFNVTFEIVTPESAEHGDAAECGFIARGLRLREALGAVTGTRTSRAGGVICIEADNGKPDASSRWLTVYNGMEFETGAFENRSLHIPDSVTGASRQRIARLF